MTSKKVQFLLITGEPGVGKTTIIKRLVTLLKDKNVDTAGFYTEEIRNNRTREGFDVVSLDGQRGRLARLYSENIAVKFKLGKYEVLVEEFEKIALPCLSSENTRKVLVIDEIGKMEFFSEPFKNKIKHLLSSNNIVLATIPFRKSDLIIENWRHNQKSKVWVVSKENRDIIHEDIIKAFEAIEHKLLTKIISC